MPRKNGLITVKQEPIFDWGASRGWILKHWRRASEVRSFLILAMTTVAAPLLAEESNRFDQVTVTSEAVAGGVYMLTGAGGNIGVSVGSDGTLLIDDQYAPLSERILAAVKALGGDQPKLIVNTHYHGDHTGANGNFGKRGVIIAQENVRLRLLEEDQPGSALPVVTFQDRIRVYFNDDEIDIIHLPAGHTDGDAIVWFKRANVVHMGDLFFNGIFPRIDIDAGGSIQGYINNLEKVLEWIPADARIIPGHGKLANLVELSEFLEMLQETSAAVQKQMAAGKDINAIVKQGVGETWQGWTGGCLLYTSPSPRD